MPPPYKGGGINPLFHSNSAGALMQNKNTDSCMCCKGHTLIPYLKQLRHPLRGGFQESGIRDLSAPPQRDPVSVMSNIPYCPHHRNSKNKNI